MKKRVNTLLLITIILVPFLFAGQNSYADNRYYEVAGYVINVNINPDGSADIEERLTYRFDGQFNGILRDVDFSATGGIENVRVYVEKATGPVEWVLNSTSNLDDGGGTGTYNLVSRGKLAQFKIFEKSQNELKTFVIKYTFRDIVVKYRDIAEFNRKIVDSGWTVALRDVVINFTLPEGADFDEIKVFGHGNLTGESKKIDERHVEFSIALVPPGNNVETLVLFPTGLVPQATQFVDKDALPDIMENEKRLAEEANKQREDAKRKVEEYEKAQKEYEQRQQENLEKRRIGEARKAALKPYGRAIASLLFLLWFPAIIYLYLKYDKEPRPEFQGKYYRELPGEYTPVEMSVLLSMGKVATRDITATLMDLVRKKQLFLAEHRYLKRGLFRSKEMIDYRISINYEAPPRPLKEHELFLIDWFIGRLGRDGSLLLNEITEHTRTESGARSFKKDYDTWCEKAKKEAGKNDFFDETIHVGRKYGLLAALSWLLMGIFVMIVFKTGTGLLLILQFAIILFFSIRLNRRTAYGTEQNAMWLAFRNFLKNFSQMDKATMPSIVIWEHYLVYAISLGVASEVIRQLPLVFTDTDLHNTGLTYMYGYDFTHFSGFTNAFDRTIANVDYAINHAMSVANSTLSSSSGGGGGFSGGSSGGGGGGGGGGAF